jgi:hypothetical protein
MDGPPTEEHTMITISPSHNTLTVVLSAELFAASHALNANRSARLEATLARLTANGRIYTYWPAMGCYFGVKERSFLFMADDAEARSIAFWLQAEYGQESVLLISNDGHGRIHYSADNYDDIGTLHNVTSAELENEPAYTTLDGASGGFIFRK